MEKTESKIHSLFTELPPDKLESLSGGVVGASGSGGVIFGTDGAAEPHPSSGGVGGSGGLIWGDRGDALVQDIRIRSWFVP